MEAGLTFVCVLRAFSIGFAGCLTFCCLGGTCRFGLDKTDLAGVAFGLAAALVVGFLAPFAGAFAVTLGLDVAGFAVVFAALAAAAGAGAAFFSAGFDTVFFSAAGLAAAAFGAGAGADAGFADVAAFAVVDVLLDVPLAGADAGFFFSAGFAARRKQMSITDIKLTSNYIIIRLVRCVIIDIFSL